MRAALAAAPDINEGGFSPLPVWVIGLAASIFFLRLIFKLGPMLLGKHGILDGITHFALLVSAASVVASVSTLDFVQNFTKIGEDLARSAGAQGWTILGYTLDATDIAYVMIVAAAFWYWKKARQEDALVLVPIILFGVTAQVGAIFNPEINSFLGMWINNPIRLVWNGFMAFLGIF